MSTESAGVKTTVTEPAGAAGTERASGETASAELTGAALKPASTGLTGAAPKPASPVAPTIGGDIALKVGRAVGAGVGYGCLAAFLCLVCVQIYRWFRDGEWMHFGISEALRAGLVRCCVKGEDTGRLAALIHWIDAPADWLGLHRVLEIAPASLGLFALSIVGNSIFIYYGDRIDRRRRLVPAPPAESSKGE